MRLDDILIFIIYIIDFINSNASSLISNTGRNFSSQRSKSAPQTHYLLAFIHAVEWSVKILSSTQNN